MLRHPVRPHANPQLNISELQNHCTSNIKKQGFWATLTAFSGGGWRFSIFAHNCHFLYSRVLALDPILDLNPHLMASISFRRKRPNTTNTKQIKQIKQPNFQPNLVSFPCFQYSFPIQRFLPSCCHALQRWPNHLEHHLWVIRSQLEDFDGPTADTQKRSDTIQHLQGYHTKIFVVLCLALMPKVDVVWCCHCK